MPEGHVAAVVLAAGASRRFGEGNKLLAPLDGRPLVARVVDALVGGGAGQVVVVTGWDGAGIARDLAERRVRLAHNSDWEAGMGGSIGVGVAGLDAAATGALIVPGDMPLLTADVVGRLIRAFDKEGGKRVVYAANRAGEQRNPVLWPRRFFAALQALPAAEGAKTLLRQLPASDLLAVEVDDEEALLDVDTPGELEAARARNERG